MKKENEEMKKQMEVEKEQIKNRYKNELEMKNREIEYKNKINRDYVNILKNDTLDEITKINVLLSFICIIIKFFNYHHSPLNIADYCTGRNCL